MWFDITGNGGHAFTLTMDATLDADAWFYTASCGFINNDTGAQAGVDEDETGIVPLSAAFVIVDGFVGTGAFTLTIA